MGKGPIKYLILSRFKLIVFCKATGLKSSDKVSDKMFFFIVGFFVRGDLWYVRSFFMRHIDAKYHDATAPLVFYFETLVSGGCSFKVHVIGRVRQ